MNINDILYIFSLAALLPFAIGMLTLYNLLRRKKLPCDESNRINHIRLWWFALTREDKFVDTFRWLRYDEWDNFAEFKEEKNDD